MPPAKPSPNRRQLLALAAGAALVPSLVSSQETTAPEDIIADLIAAMAENDGGRIAAKFAKTAEQAYGTRPPRTGEAFRAWLQSDIINAHGRLENAQLSGDGDTVIATGLYRNAQGYASDANFLFVVEGEKITRWIIR